LRNSGRFEPALGMLRLTCSTDAGANVLGVGVSAINMEGCPVRVSRPFTTGAKATSALLGSRNYGQSQPRCSRRDNPQPVRSLPRPTECPTVWVGPCRAQHHAPRLWPGLHAGNVPEVGVPRRSGTSSTAAAQVSSRNSMQPAKSSSPESRLWNVHTAVSSTHCR